MRKDIIGSQADVARQILEALGRIEQLTALTVPPGVQPPDVYGRPMSDWQQVIAMGICACIPAAPILARQVVIGPTGNDLLIRNESNPYVPVTVVNEDLAQWIWVGPRGVLQTAGDVIIPLDKEHYVLGKGQELYARCAFATTNVSVVEGGNLYANFIAQLAPPGG